MEYLDVLVLGRIGCVRVFLLGCIGLFGYVRVSGCIGVFEYAGVIGCN